MKHYLLNMCFNTDVHTWPSGHVMMNLLGDVMMNLLGDPTKHRCDLGWGGGGLVFMWY